MLSSSMFFDEIARGSEPIGVHCMQVSCGARRLNAHMWGRAGAGRQAWTPATLRWPGQSWLHYEGRAVDAKWMCNRGQQPSEPLTGCWLEASLLHLTPGL